MNVETDFAQHMEVVARILLGEPNARLSSATEWRFGTHGSLAVDLEKGVWFDHETGEGGGVLPLINREKGIHGREAIAWMKREGIINGHINGQGKHSGTNKGADRVPFNIVAEYDYRDFDGRLLFQVCRLHPKDFRQRRPNGKGWTWNVKGVRAIPYRLVEIDEKMAEDRTIFIVEGEKDVDALWAIGAPATTNSGGAGKWQPELAKYFRGANIILPDNDQPGRAHARKVAKALCGTAANVRILQLPGLPPNGGDVSDWIGAGGPSRR
jgi:putative DNA primase/helicase